MKDVRQEGERWGAGGTAADTGGCCEADEALCALLKGGQRLGQTGELAAGGASGTRSLRNQWLYEKVQHKQGSGEGMANREATGKQNLLGSVTAPGGGERACS